MKFCDRKSNQYKELLVNNNIDINYCYEILAKEFITSIENSSNDKLLMAKDAIKQLKIIKNCKIFFLILNENFKKKNNKKFQSSRNSKKNYPGNDPVII